MLTITHEGKEIQVAPEAVKLADGYALITPTSIPQGFLKQEAVDRIVGERVNTAKSKAVEEFVNDPTKHETILSKYNVTLKDGKAVGVEGADISEIKKQVYNQAKAELEEQYKPARGENAKLKSRVLQNELKAAALQQGVKPSLVDLVVRSYSDTFELDKDGNVLKKDAKGGFELDQSGEFINPSKWFEQAKKSDALKDLFDNTPQRGAGVGNSQGQQTNFNGVRTKADLKDKVAQNAFIAANGAEAYLNLPDK